MTSEESFVMSNTFVFHSQNTVIMSKKYHEVPKAPEKRHIPFTVRANENCCFDVLLSWGKKSLTWNWTQYLLRPNHHITAQRQLKMSYSRKYPHTLHSKSCNKCSVSLTGIQWISPNFVNFDRNSRKTIQNLSKFWNSPRMSKVGILHKLLLLPFLEILKFLGTQFSVVHRGGVDIFWNSPIGPGKYGSKFSHCACKAQSHKI